jgi:hypothetical protein
VLPQKATSPVSQEVQMRLDGRPRGSSEYSKKNALLGSRGTDPSSLRATLTALADICKFNSQLQRETSRTSKQVHHDHAFAPCSRVSLTRYHVKKEGAPRRGRRSALRASAGAPPPPRRPRAWARATCASSPPAQRRVQQRAQRCWYRSAPRAP